MRRADLCRLLLLAAIWGGSFLFMRILAPVIGAFWTAELRVFIAGVAMFLFMLAIRESMQFGQNWKQYLILGVLNSALPFSLFSYAALTLPAGYSAIVNATSPLWGTLVGAVLLGEKLTMRKIGGLFIGVVGVAFLVRLGPAAFTHDVAIAALACVGAAICYGFAGAYSKKASVSIAPRMMATGSQLAAAVALLPFALATRSPVDVASVFTPFLALIMLALGLLCSGVAYFIFFRLIADVGPSKALTVTFLVPLFAMVWGALFLDESVTLITLAGCALVVVATWLVVSQSAVKAKAPA